MESKVVLPVDGDDDGPIPLGGNRHFDARRYLLGLHKTESVFDVVGKGWGFEIAGDTVYPTRIRIGIVDPGRISVQYGRLRKHAAATRWCELRRKGSSWVGTLPIGPQGGNRRVKVSNRYFPRLGARTVRRVRQGVQCARPTRSSWSGPGYGEIFIEEVHTAESVEVTESFDGTKVYRVNHWFDIDGVRWARAYTEESVRAACIGAGGLVNYPRLLSEIEEKTVASYYV